MNLTPETDIAQMDLPEADKVTIKKVCKTLKEYVIQLGRNKLFPHQKCLQIKADVSSWQLTRDLFLRVKRHLLE